MARVVEIELKFEVLNRIEIQRFVQPLKMIEQKHIVDIYLDTEKADLYGRSIFLRIRNGDNFDIKFKLEDLGKSLHDNIDHTHCDEVSHSLPFTDATMLSVNDTLKLLGLNPMTAPTFKNLMDRNNLVEFITIDKQRTSYEDGEFHIDLDTVKGLGEYLEIEKVTDAADDQREVIERMKARLAGQKLKHIDAGYTELYMRKHNFDLYLKGKYLLAEDRKKYRQ